MRNDRDVPMDLWILKIDETEYFTERFLKMFPEIKRVFGVYMFDMNLRAYAAESRGSYELQFLQYQWDGNEVGENRWEEIEEALMEAAGTTELWSYIHVSDVDHQAKYYKKGFFPKGRMGRVPWQIITVKELEEEYEGERDEAMQDAVENFFGNPI